MKNKGKYAVRASKYARYQQVERVNGAVRVLIPRLV
jgi:hypothetical protein